MLYVHALLGKKPDLRGLRGHGGKLRVAGAAAPFAVVEELSAPPSVEDAESLRSQDALLRELLEQTASVLPCRFGTALADAAALKAVVEGKKTALLAALRQVAGRVQMNLTIEASRPIAKPSLPRGRSGFAYLQAKKQLADFQKSAPELTALRRKLSRLVAAERVRRIDAPPVRVKVFHLVDAERVDAYRAVFARPDVPFRIHVTGPHPPYAFFPEEVPS